METPGRLFGVLPLFILSRGLWHCASQGRGGRAAAARAQRDQPGHCCRGGRGAEKPKTGGSGLLLSSICLKLFLFVPLLVLKGIDFTTGHIFMFFFQGTQANGSFSGTPKVWVSFCSRGEGLGGGGLGGKCSHSLGYGTRT